MGKQRHKKVERIVSEHNNTSIILKVLAWLCFISGLVVGCIWAKTIDEYWVGLAILAIWAGGSIFVFLIFYTIAEIVQIMHDIRKQVVIMASRK